MIDADILDVSDALDDWLRPILIKKVTKTTVDFEEVQTSIGRNQDCMIQVAQPEQLIKMQLDISLRHIRVHSKLDLDMKELVEFEGKDFRVITPSQWSGYGYVDVLAAETKEPLVIPDSIIRLAPKFNGSNQSAKSDNIVISGDYSASIKIQSTFGIGSRNEVLIGNDESTAVYIGFLSGNFFRFRTPRGGNVDAPLPAQLIGSTEQHKVSFSFVGNSFAVNIDNILVASGTTSNTKDFVINSFGSYLPTIAAFFGGFMYDFDDSIGNKYTMNDGDGIMRSSGAGDNGSYQNWTADIWELITA